MATVTKDFRVKNGLVVEGSTATVNGHDVLTESLVDAKGDLLVASGADAVTRLAAGTNGYVLTANSSATNGLEWAAAPAVGSFETSIVFEGATADSFETTLAVTDATADRTITLPDATGTVALTSDVTTHANLTEAHGATGAVVGTTNTQTLTNKTLTSPKINEDVAVTATATELNILDGATLSTTELNYVDGVTSAIQTQLDAKFATANASTTNISEGTNLYFTDERAQDAVGNSVGTGLSYNDSTGAISVNTSTIQARVADVSDTEIGYLNGVTSAIQTQIDAKASLSGATFTGAVSGTSLTLSGDLTVNGTTTTINSTEITIDDKNLVLGAVATPSDAGADGGGITLKGATDKTLNWVDATDSWTSSEHINLASGKELKIAGTSVLSGSTLGSGVTGSSLTSVGTISSGTWNGTAIAVANGGTGITSFGTGIATFLGTPSSDNLRATVTDETGTGALVFANTPTLVTPNIGAATATSITLTDALIGTATQALTDTNATVVDSWSATTYSTAKYIVQMTNGSDIEVLEVLVTVDGNDNVYLTEYADIISNTSIGTTDADFSSGNVRLKVTASNGTTVKVHKTLIEA